MTTLASVANEGGNTVEDCAWRNYGYKVGLGKWQIAILIEAGYRSLRDNEPNHEMIYLDHGVYFSNKLLPYPQSQPLLPQEMQFFCHGLKIVAKQISASLPRYPNSVIILRSALFSDCDRQDEAFTAAAIEWAGKTFQFEPPNYQVSFDSSQGEYGRYVFDFPEV